MIRHHTSYQGLRCISPAFPASRPHRDEPATHTRKPDITHQKSENLRAVGHEHLQAASEVLFYHRTRSRKEIDFVGEPLNGTAVEGKYTETGRWRGEAATVTASDWAGILTTRNVLDCTDPDGPWAVPAGILTALTDT